MRENCEPSVRRRIVIGPHHECCTHYFSDIWLALYVVSTRRTSYFL
jgi:hypothetical protein